MLKLKLNNTFVFYHKQLILNNLLSLQNLQSLPMKLLGNFNFLLTGNDKSSLINKNIVITASIPRLIIIFIFQSRLQ